MEMSIASIREACLRLFLQKTRFHSAGFGFETCFVEGKEEGM